VLDFWRSEHASYTHKGEAVVAEGQFSGPTMSCPPTDLLPLLMQACRMP
jgi:hypothetical protein